MKVSRDVASLIEIMAALRTAGSGCPWDLAQTFATIAPYTIEARGDLEDLRDELGDLLLQVVFHARMAQEAGAFDFGDVVQAISEKLLRRHPHVFGEAGSLSAEQVSGLWQRIKAAERAERSARRPAEAQRSSTLADVAPGLPALARALKLQAKAATVGFDWNDAGQVLAKIVEEAEEVASSAATSPEHVAEELGDLLFAVVNLARHHGVDPESALRATNAKFERRFAAIEQALAARGKTPNESTLAEMDALWDAAKAAERSG